MRKLLTRGRTGPMTRRIAISLFFLLFFSMPPRSRSSQGEVTTFPSGELTLHGVLYRPNGAGPFRTLSTRLLHVSQVEITGRNQVWANCCALWETTRLAPKFLRRRPSGGPTEVRLRLTVPVQFRQHLDPPPSLASVHSLDTDLILVVVKHGGTLFCQGR